MVRQCPLLSRRAQRIFRKCYKCMAKNINIATFLKYNAEIVVRQRYNCYFCTVKVLFQTLEHIFQTMKHVFQTMKYIFQTMEQQFEH